MTATASNCRTRFRRPAISFCVCAATLFVVQACQDQSAPAEERSTIDVTQTPDAPVANAAAAAPVHAAVDQSNAEASKAAFLEAYKVLMHPRCMNCHPIGDVPLQGEDSHLHAMGPTRGTDGKGVYAMKCSNCHQHENVPGLNMPPGNPNWHLPPADMKMVFEGKSPAELARQLLDPEKNGHKTLDQIIEHVTHDSLVLAGWNPGEGRELPPLTHEQFAAKMKEWADKGAAIPD